MFKKLFLSSLALSLTIQLHATAQDFCAEARKKPARCNYKELSEAQIRNSLFLTDIVGAKIKELEASEKAQGRELKVVILARQGTNLDKLGVLKDTDSQGNYRSVDQLAQQINPSGIVSQMSEGEGSTTSPYQQLMYELDKKRTIKYSHLGIAVRNHKESDISKGYWKVFQLLWHCEDDVAGGFKENQSALHEDGMAAFFVDHMNAYGAQIMIPTQEIQNNVEQLLLKKDNRRLIESNLHQSNYNAGARFDDLSEENSNSYILDVLTAGLYKPGVIQDRAQGFDVLRKTNYLPTKVVPLGLFSLMGLPLVDKFLPSTICFQNQKYIKSLLLGEIVTTLSIEEWLRRNNWMIKSVETGLKDSELFKDTAKKGEFVQGDIRQSK